MHCQAGPGTTDSLEGVKEAWNADATLPQSQYVSVKRPAVAADVAAGAFVGGAFGELGGNFPVGRPAPCSSLVPNLYEVGREQRSSTWGRGRQKEPQAAIF